MAEPKAKERVLDAVRGLPDDATVEDAWSASTFSPRSKRGSARQTLGRP
jgi:hypothetical protein